MTRWKQKGPTDGRTYAMLPSEDTGPTGQWQALAEEAERAEVIDSCFTGRAHSSSR